MNNEQDVDLEQESTPNKKTFHDGIYLIPNLITVSATFCGFLAIVSAFRGQFAYAAQCVGLAIVLDGLDGRVARRLNATSPFGKEFDSLSDVIAFGVAPAVLFYVWAFSSLADEFGILLSFVFVVCTATRLARFNTASPNEGMSYFRGLPSPGGAAAVVSVVYWAPTQMTSLDSGYKIYILMFYFCLVAWLMVSNVAYPSLKKLTLPDLRIPAHRRIIIVLCAMFVAAAWYNFRFGIAAGSAVYALSGPVLSLYRLQKKRSSQR